jgi:hypothetical protein
VGLQPTEAVIGPNDGEATNQRHLLLPENSSVQPCSHMSFARCHRLAAESYISGSNAFFLDPWARKGRVTSRTWISRSHDAATKDLNVPDT